MRTHIPNLRMTALNGIIVSLSCTWYKVYIKLKKRDESRIQQLPTLAL